MKPRAIVLNSGGIDSTTTLAIASQDYDCFTLCFDYGQKHRVELDAARWISESLGALSHHVFAIPLQQIGHSALTDPAIPVEDYKANLEIPSTYVPARNTIFLSIALGFAEIFQAQALFFGMNADDVVSYVDCRKPYINAFEHLANLATKAGVEQHPLSIVTPLANLTKAQVIERGLALGVDYTKTVTCYRADQQARACGHCESCVIRLKGFEENGLKDPATYLP